MVSLERNTKPAACLNMAGQTWLFMILKLCELELVNRNTKVVKKSSLGNEEEYL